jgi:7,8-dihydroneopterin aldolase/epimerase/oxygenase
MSIVSVEGMEFFAYHGCFKEEAIIGTKFVVDVSIETDTRKAEETDDLSTALNYQHVFLLVKKEVEIRSNLLEHVGRRILNSIKKEFPFIVGAKLKISKMNPPLGGKVHQVSLTMTI